ncbi:LOW QUALITY PROTEIN: hypothetical protein CVT26_000620 [Gymnopilus dilepis]|uniref:Cytochrome P450 n=1 Tax=Gymnopilus dilepis TaxID=231916 RepID=A0A409Y272_9AGAR|nr:LOW QUALITY PROTEIN: hypothetical protein CVT26_000620 [Gymnopilus dilepis]
MCFERDVEVGNTSSTQLFGHLLLPFNASIFPTPADLPHCVEEDDIYEGLYVKKGTLVIANIWTIVRDESIYPEASKFRPERFMEEASPELSRKRDPRNYIFGFGRRQGL